MGERLQEATDLIERTGPVDTPEYVLLAMNRAYWDQRRYWEGEKLARRGLTTFPANPDWIKLSALISGEAAERSGDLCLALRYYACRIYVGIPSPLRRNSLRAQPGGDVAFWANPDWVGDQVTAALARNHASMNPETWRNLKRSRSRILLGLRDAIHLIYDFLRYPIFQLTTAQPPDFGFLWGRLGPFVIISGGLVGGLAL